MKKLFLTGCFIFAVLSSFAQKAMNDYTLQELTQKRAEASAAKSAEDVAVYDAAIGFKKEIDAALKVEDYDKAAALKEKLKALKLNSTNAARIKEIKENIAKAVAREDYETAKNLKTEMEALLISGDTKSSKTTAVPAAPAVPVTKFTKNDIYGNSVTYMGLDYGLFKLVSTSMDEDKKMTSKHIPFWIEEYQSAVKDKKIGEWLGKSQFAADHAFTETSYLKAPVSSWIVATPYTLTNEQIQKQIQSYTTTSHGLGLVFMQGAYDEIKKEINVYVVWFDLDTRALVHVQPVTRHSRPAVFGGRWLTGLVDFTHMYIDEFYKKRL